MPLKEQAESTELRSLSFSKLKQVVNTLPVGIKLHVRYKSNGEPLLDKYHGKPVVLTTFRNQQRRLTALRLEEDEQDEEGAFSSNFKDDLPTIILDSNGDEVLKFIRDNLVFSTVAPVEAQTSKSKTNKVKRQQAQTVQVVEPRLNEGSLKWLQQSRIRNKLLEVLQDPSAEFIVLSSVFAETQGINDTEKVLYNNFYRWIERNFGQYYKGGRETFHAYLQHIHAHPERLDKRSDFQEHKEEESRYLKKYGSLPQLSAD